MDWLRTTEFAHRGLHGLSAECPENSMQAVEEALAHGYGIEIDIQRSMDNEAMVFHDLSLKRLTGDARLLANMQARELKRIRISGTSSRITGLREILDYIRGRTPLLLEVKTAPGIPGLLEMRVAELIRRYPGPLALMSWLPSSVEMLSLLAPHVPVGRVVRKMPDPQAPDRVRWRDRLFTPMFGFGSSNRNRFMACNIEGLFSQALPARQTDNPPLLAWTVTSGEEAGRARELADNIIFEGFRP